MIVVESTFYIKFTPNSNPDLAGLDLYFLFLALLRYRSSVHMGSADPTIKT